MYKLVVNKKYMMLLEVMVSYTYIFLNGRD